MSHILCVVDGMTDAAFTAADYPHLSAMECAGRVDTTQGGRTESLNCILHLLGQTRVPPHLRGYAEALAEDIPLEPGDLILRGSWFSVDEQGRCVAPLAGEPCLTDPCGRYRYYFIDRYKAILVFPGLAPYVDAVRTYPPYGCAGACAQAFKPDGPEILRQCFDDWLQSDRCLIPWGESVCAAMPPFPLKSAVVCGASVVKGIGRLLQMELIPVEGATGEVDTNLAGKVQAALLAAEQTPFVLLHINGADEAAHRRDAAEKQAFLQKVDRVVLAELLASRHRITVVSDHGTDPETGQHRGGPQPYYRKQEEV